MPQITFNNNNYECHEDETVLACLTRHRVDYPCACRAGVCQSCLAQLAQGDMVSDWQKGLKETFVAQNYFLACLAKPKKDIALFLPGLKDITNPAIIKQINYFNTDVVCLQLRVEQLAAWTPGQYVNIINLEGHRRSYSIANVPEEDGYIELHIKLMPKGMMSDWLKTVACPGLTVYLQGPMGECFYVNTKRENFPMVLAGTGTGLAPLLAIVREAIRQHHQGPIHLIHGGVCARDLYLETYLQNLAKQHQRFFYESCVLQGDGVHQEAKIDNVLLKALQGRAESRVYVCGSEDIVKKLKKIAFLAGVSSSHIYSDAFIDTGKAS